MNPPPPAAPSPPPAAAPETITETQAFTRAWMLFTALFVVVIGLLWAVNKYFG